ncbi:MAG: hypothetical protein K2M20_10170 [Lachnospiraceae bacterium]|nr:hypothetical protein [Lachnospiraceae bacterium]
MFKMYFNDTDTPVEIFGFMDTEDGRISILCESPTENNSGFRIFEETDSEKTLIFDGSDYKYRWDVLKENRPPDEIWYTNIPSCQQTEPWPVHPDPDDAIILEDPLSAQELTEAIADLMCEVSMMQLNI